MLDHPRALVGLSDAGAHVGTVCDASFTTFMLTHWVRDRALGRLPLERAVHMLSARNADYLGLADRGRIAPGQRADLNLIDPQRLAVGTPRLVRDLPAGGRRFLQKGEGYLRHLGRRPLRAAGRRDHSRAAGPARSPGAPDARRRLSSAANSTTAAAPSHSGHRPKRDAQARERREPGRGPATRLSSTPRVNGGSCATTCRGGRSPRWRRCWWRGASGAGTRACACARCSGAAARRCVSPNQPMLLTLAKHRRRLRRVDETPRQLFAEQVFVADVRRHALAAAPRTTAGSAAPRAKSPSGMFISSVNQRKPGRDELAERHQVELVVAVAAARPAADRPTTELV